jgi:hypothetical protein
MNGPDHYREAERLLEEAEKSFRMSKHDLKARSIYHHKRESIDAPSWCRFWLCALLLLVRGADEHGDVQREVQDGQPMVNGGPV